MLKRVLCGFGLLLINLCAAGTALAQCQWGWAPGFGIPGVDDTVLALAAFDDGNGPALYVGGRFTTAGEVGARYIACWDGSTWSPVGEGTRWQVLSLAVFDDGTGPALYAGLNGSPSVQKWAGTGWTVVGGGVGGNVYALIAFDDGSGPALYAAVDSRVIRWDGQAWTQVGAMTCFDWAPTVNALAVYDDGTGPALYAGGHFTKVNGMNASSIAKWDGTSWSRLDGGVAALFDRDVLAMTVFDDGTGLALYVGGALVYAGSVVANGIAKWDGSTWSALGSGVADYARVHALAVYDDGGGPALYAGGEFTTAGGVFAPFLARWDGSAWFPVGSGTNAYIYALTVFDDGRGAALYMGGEFDTAGNVGAHHVAGWGGTRFDALGSGNGLSNQVEGLAVFDDGNGPALYACGLFGAAGTTVANAVAKWDGSSWSPLGSGLDRPAAGMCVFDDGSGPALYVGGEFTTAGGVETNSIAKWDGVRWSALGSGVGGGPYVLPDVIGLTVFDDGRGPALYVGGNFTTAGGSAANRIAKWDGSTWSALGSGVSGGYWSPPTVTSLAVFDDGSGAALYVGGWFATAGGVTVNNLAKWDGTRWWPVGGGVTTYGGWVSCMTVFDDGSGPALYVGGGFYAAGDVSANNIAKWDGAMWSALGSGVTELSGTGGSVVAAAVFDAGDAPALYVGGYFRIAGGISANCVARWDGTMWSALGGGAYGEVYALSPLAEVDGPALYVGGHFMQASGRVSARIGKWACASGAFLGDLNCDGQVDAFDINPFVLALSSRADYDENHPNCRWLNADCNEDGVVNFADINPFVRLLLGAK